MRTVERAFSIFECFSLQRPSLTLQEIANQIGLAKSTTSRLVGTLERLGYLTRASDLKYSLSLEFVRLAGIAGKTLDARRVLRPLMEELVLATGESVTLNTIDGDTRVCVDVARSASPLYNMNRPGERARLGLGGASLVLMAYMPLEKLDLIIAGAAKAARCSVKELRSILETVHAQGYAVSHGGGIRNLSGISMPIFEGDGTVNYCISVVVPTKRVAGHVVDLLVALRHTALTASRRLGGIGGAARARDAFGARARDITEKLDASRGVTVSSPLRTR
jgi:DNA-binding IclR family transcriptional regulator